MNSILVSILLNLGDVVMATGALSLLREKYPDAKIDVMVRPESVDILRRHPLVDEVLEYRYRSGSFLHNLGAVVSEVRRRRYDTYLALDRRARSAVIMRLAGIPNRIGPSIFSSYLKPAFWTRFLYTRVVPMTVEDCANVVWMFQAMTQRAFAIAGTKPIPNLPLLPESIAKAEAILKNAAGPVIGLSVKANHALKNWPPERFAELMRRLREKHGAFLYVTGAPADREYVANLLAMCPGCGVLNLAGETSLMDLVALASKSNLFITLDTGAMHLAGHSGLSKMISIYGCTSPALVGQSVPDAVVVWADADCCPCHKKPEECPDHRCMREIDVDTVYDKAAALLADVRTEPYD